MNNSAGKQDMLIILVSNEVLLLINTRHIWLNWYYTEPELKSNPNIPTKHIVLCWQIFDIGIKKNALTIANVYHNTNTSVYSSGR